MNLDMEELVIDFNHLVRTFATYAERKKAKDNKRMEEINAELTDLGKKLEKINVSLVAFGALAAAALPITGVAAALSGPAAPFVIVSVSVVAHSSHAHEWDRSVV